MKMSGLGTPQVQVSEPQASQAVGASSVVRLKKPSDHSEYLPRG